MPEEKPAVPSDDSVDLDIQPAAEEVKEDPPAPAPALRTVEAAWVSRSNPDHPAGVERADRRANAPCLLEDGIMIPASYQLRAYISGESLDGVVIPEGHQPKDGDWLCRDPYDQESVSLIPADVFKKTYGE